MFYVGYNGVILELTQTLDFRRIPVYDELTGTDYLHTRYILDVEGIYNPAATSYIPIPGAIEFAPSEGQLPPVTDLAIRSALERPRGRLLYILNGVSVIDSPLKGAVADVLDGPKPRLVQIRKITQRTWTVRFQIETHINECAATLEAPGLLSNQFSTTHDVNHPDHLTTIVYEGVATFRRDVLANLGTNADAYRDLVIPPVSYWMQRKRVTVRLDPKGHAIYYRVVDKEEFRALGDTSDAKRHGVVDWDATLTVQSHPAAEGGVVSEQSTAAIQGYVRGDSQSKRAGLLTWAVKLAVEKLRIATGPAVPGFTNPIIQVSFAESVKRFEIHFLVAVLVPPAKQVEPGAGPVRTAMLGIDAVTLFANDGMNPQMPNGNARGRYGARALAASIKAACAAPAMPDTTACVPLRKRPYLAGSDCEVDVAFGFAPLPLQATRYSNETVNNGATSFAVDVEWVREGGKVAVPVAGDGTEPPVVLTLSNPVCYRVVSFVGERWGSKPMVPAPESRDTREELVGSPSLVFAAPEILPDGHTRVYRVSGQYVYVRRDNRGPGDEGLFMGAVPWADFPYEDTGNLVTINDYRHGITGPNSTIS
jgi:hypothetical protein